MQIIYKCVIRTNLTHPNLINEVIDIQFKSQLKFWRIF